MRPDLQWAAIEHGPQRWWVVKDPVAQAYYRLYDEELAVLQMLDGRQSLAQIRQRFESLFAPLRLTAEQLQAFLGRLHSLGLVLAEQPGQGAQLRQRTASRRRRELFGRLANVLAVRFRGCDPQPLLVRLTPVANWLFSPLALGLWCLLLITAGALLAGQYETVRARLPELSTLVAPRNLGAFAVAVAVAKILHELGHALAARRYGVECHEVGLMLLVFTPCLYCNVSDAWMLPGRWPRIVISAAGILVELALAAVCGLLWLASAPGVFNSVCLSLTLVCSVNTLLFNGNPLLRYDGYYIASDLLGLPNLATQAQEALGRLLARLALGVHLPPARPQSHGETLLLVVYAVAATAYRWALSVAIVWLLYRILAPWGLAIIAQGLGVLVIAGLLAAPVRAVIRWFRWPGLRRHLRRSRAVFGITLLSGLALLLLTIPMPARVRAPASVQAATAQNVYVVAPGVLQEALAPGTAVKAGDVIGRLASPALDRELATLAGQRENARVQYEGLRRRLENDAALAPLLPGAEETFRDAQARFDQRQRDAASLILRAPQDGSVIPPPHRPAQHPTDGRLPSWHGIPQDASNVGCSLETGTLFCQVGDPQAVTIQLLIEQSDRSFVAVGQAVRLKFSAATERIIGGTLVALSETPLQVLPRELAAVKTIATRPDEQGLPRPVDTLYQATVHLDTPARLLPGSVGQAKILVAAQPLWRQVGHVLQRTFSLGGPAQ